MTPAEHDLLAPEGALVWITGLPSSGKSTFARQLNQHLRGLGVPSCLLDGDEVRACLVPSPGYDDEARANFYETLTRLSATLVAQGLVVTVPATAMRQAFRDGARARVQHFVEVFMDTPLEVCEARDAKGLYAKSRAGVTNNVPGAGVAYESPPSPDVTVRPGEHATAIDQIVRRLRASP